MSGTSSPNYDNIVLDEYGRVVQIEDNNDGSMAGDDGGGLEHQQQHPPGCRQHVTDHTFCHPSHHDGGAASEYQHAMPCWLCEYNQDPEAVLLSRFISDNAAHMGPEQLSNAVFLRLSAPEIQGEGRSFAHIRNHVEHHVLAPSVQISGMLRSLIALLNKLEKTLQSPGDEGIQIIDSKNVAVYLKVVNEIMQIYKSGENSKLMFAGSMQAKK